MPWVFPIDEDELTALDEEPDEGSETDAEADVGVASSLARGP